MTSLSDKYFSRYWPKYQFRRVVTEISDPFLWKIQFSHKWTVLQKKYWKQTPIIFWRSATSVENFSQGPIVWPKFAKTCSWKYSKIPESSTDGALKPKPWVVLKNLIHLFVPYNLLNKSPVGSIFFELHSFFCYSDMRN